MTMENIEITLDDGENINVEFSNLFYYVYALFYNEMPVYVGCTTDIENRIRAHKTGKKFDSYRIIYQNSNKGKALQFERACIVFLKVISDNHYNKQKIWIPGLNRIKI
jgi:hypothetical protein